MATETELRDWRYGQTQAERLCAGLLQVEGFSDIDPQAPLGGPDGTKDIRCKKDGKSWIGAVYFPPTTVSYRDIQVKFENDLSGVGKNGAEALAFFVNKPLTIGERTGLIAAAKGTAVEIYHLERLRGILDAPKGYGLRLEYLRIQMSMEDQLAFFSTINYEEISRGFRQMEQTISAKLDALLAQYPKALDGDGGSTLEREGLQLQDLFAEEPTRVLSLSMICWLQTVLSYESPFPESSHGRLRSMQTQFTNPTTGTEVWRPPAPEAVPSLLVALLEWWRDIRSNLNTCSEELIIERLAEFHHRFLSIHPFLDGNGRVARAILNQASKELLSKSVGEELLEPPAEYYKSLMSAANGDSSPLVNRIKAALR